MSSYVLIHLPCLCFILVSHTFVSSHAKSSPIMINILKDISIDYHIDLHIDSFAW